jgi:hypothetical protein
MTAPHAGDDTLAILPMPSGAALGGEQARRATCLAMALGLLRGRSVPTLTVFAIARWLYDGEVVP